MGGLLNLVQRGAACAGCGPPSPLLIVPNVTAHPSAASVPVTVLLYDGPLLCSFNVVVKGLNNASKVFVCFLFVCLFVCYEKAVTATEMTTSE